MLEEAEDERISLCEWLSFASIYQSNLDEFFMVRVGSLAVQVHATPGHAPGSTSFSWRSCEGTDCRQIVYADSVSALADGEYLYSDHPEYRASFESGMQAIADIDPCDILLTPHPSVSALWPRLRGEQPMASEGTCRALGCTPDAVQIILTDIKKENWAEAGKLFSD